MADRHWSDEHVSRANRFALHVVVAWVVLATLSASLAGSGGNGLLLYGVLAAGATWLLVHSLFAQVDELVRTRLEEAEALDLSDVPEPGGEREDASSRDGDGSVSD